MHFKYKGLNLAFCVLAGVFSISCQSWENADDAMAHAVKDDVVNTKEGDSITLTGTFEMPEAVLATRSAVGNVENLHLLVFDENHRFIQRAEAVLSKPDKNLSGQQTPNGNPGVLENKMLSFSAKLLSSNKNRTIHFVANYDFPAELSQDYLLRDMDEGELMNKLVESRLNRAAYWRAFSFNGLSSTSFNNRVFRLLRNQAEVQLVIERSADFELKGFCLHNAPRRGTVAPYVSKQSLDNADVDAHYRDVLYSFPTNPTEPTLLGKMHTYDALSADGNITNDAWKTNKSNIAVFEYKNSDAPRDKQVSLIMYGQKRVNGRLERAGYYKIDLKKDLFYGQDYMGSEPYDIIRNHLYKVTVNSVINKGYNTMEQALAAPAGNNIFASVELQDFAQVSDKNYTLNVGATEVLLTKPSVYTTNFVYRRVNTNNDMFDKVNVYYNRKPVAQAFNNDPYIQSVNFNKSNGTLTVTTKQNFPTSGFVSYKLLVIADSKDRATPSRIQRIINLTLRPPYNFNASLTNYTGATVAQGQLVQLAFNVPSSIPAQLLPYTLLMEANGLTPSEDQNIKLVIKDKKIFYEYTVLPSDQKLGTKILYFKRNNSRGGVGVKLSSYLFADQNVTL